MLILDSHDGNCICVSSFFFFIVKFEETFLLCGNSFGVFSHISNIEVEFSFEIAVCFEGKMYWLSKYERTTQ